MPTAPTVRLDVGGKLYRVSKALLETYPDSMLARLVSDTWNENNMEEDDNIIFIDRDGDRFRFVLDYLRDSEFYSSRMDETVLREIDYFGIPYSNQQLQPGLQQRVKKAAGHIFQQYAQEVRQSARRWIPTSGVPPGTIIECEITCQQYGEEKRLADPGETELIALFGMVTIEQLSEIWIPEVGIKVCSIRFHGIHSTKNQFGLQAVPFV